MEIHTEISKWGNSVGMRIPSKLAKDLGLKEGVGVLLRAHNGDLVASPARKKHTLKEMIDSVKRSGRGEYIDTGPEVGKEIVEWE